MTVTKMSKRLPNSRAIRRAVNELLALEFKGVPEVSVLLCSDWQMQELNRQYRGKDAPTDVLSFSQDAVERSPEGRVLLGDVVVSLDTADKQARERGHDLETECVLLALHGTLHLLGYDDETDEHAQLMLDKADEIARSLGHSPGGTE